MDINLLFYFKMSAARSETGVHQMQFTISLADSIMYLFKKKKLLQCNFWRISTKKKRAITIPDLMMLFSVTFLFD